MAISWESLFYSKFSTLANCAPYQASQNIALVRFDGLIGSVGEHKSSGAQMIGDNPHRNVITHNGKLEILSMTGLKFGLKGVSFIRK